MAILVEMNSKTRSETVNKRQSAEQHNPHRCVDSATIIHYYPKDRQNKWFSIDLLCTTKLARKGDSFVIGETEKEDFATIAKLSHGIQNRSLKDIHSVRECGFFIFLPNRCMHWLRPPDTILDK